MAVVRAFAITSMPFVTAEIATGVVSFLTRELKIPPMMGIGTAVDAAILVVGMVVLMARAFRTGCNREITPETGIEE